MQAPANHPAPNEHHYPFAHSAPDGEPWEPLFTEFGPGEAQCQGSDGHHCQRCSDLDAAHGHLNKVAWWAAKFAGDMFP